VIAITFLIAAIINPHSCSCSHDRWLDALILHLNQNGAAADWNCSNTGEKSDPIENFLFFFFLILNHWKSVDVLFQ